jgi:hypothetical protein
LAALFNAVLVWITVRMTERSRLDSEPDNLGDHLGHQNLAEEAVR